jgi:phosphatidylserine/phosphatidylglycerophosphate/cardiolipin synthase-like enzyme
MPMQGYEAENKLASLYAHAHKTIKIAIYSFTNRKLAFALKKAAAKGVKIVIIADKKESSQPYSKIPNLATVKNIQVRLIKGKPYRKSGDYGKMHAKMSIVDDEYLITGSANYSYSAFFKNYEYIIISQNKEKIKAFNRFFDYLYKRSKPFRFSR